MPQVLKTEKEIEEFKTWTLGLLHDRNAKDLRITFTKRDGTEREMHCTLVEEAIPQEKQPKTKTEGSSTAGSTVRVFDVEKQEWRSFRWDSVTKVSFEL